MKRVFVILLFAAIAITSIAQENDGIEVLFGQATKVRGFIGPVFELTSIADEFTGMAGVGGGVMLDNFFLGGCGVGLIDNTQITQDVQLSYGGLLLGYTFLSNKTLHPSISALMGMGSVSSPDYLFDDDNVFVLSPTIELEINFTRFLKVSVGASYRFVGAVSENGAMLENYNNRDFSGPAGIISFRFGWFQ